MAVSKILGDLLFAPYRIGKLQKNRNIFYVSVIAQIPYFLFPGVLFLVGAALYLVFVYVSTLTLSFLDLLINSKKYKYFEDANYSEEYRNTEYPLLEV